MITIKIQFDVGGGPHLMIVRTKDEVINRILYFDVERAVFWNV